MKVAFTGASGFIAKAIRAKLSTNDVVFFALKRNASLEEWKQIIQKSDVVINLAGAPVIQRWIKKNRTQIYDSRILTTRKLVTILNELEINDSEKLLISASAIGLYPNSGNHLNTEYDYSYGTGFLAHVVKEWEHEAKKLINTKVRLVLPRIGIVLGKEGGLLKKTLPLFKLGLGGEIASGEQTMSFIHIDDLVKAISFFISNKTTVGAYNLVAPELVNNRIFTSALGEALNKPTLFRVPSFALKILYGQASEIMVKGEKVSPARLLETGFNFSYPTIISALRSSI